jgi:hypothetical protein
MAEFGEVLGTGVARFVVLSVRREYSTGFTSGAWGSPYTGLAISPANGQPGVLCSTMRPPFSNGRANVGLRSKKGSKRAKG